jgi:MFS family permease
MDEPGPRSAKVIGENAAQQRPRPSERIALPSRQSQHGLDWFAFFLADVQTGFGPFVAVYLTEHKWPQVDIGLIFTVGGLIGVFGQIPGGAIVDAARSTRLVAAFGVLAVALSALALAVAPVFPVVLASRVLQAGGSCVLGPAIAALSLGLVRRSQIGERLGRNAAFASAGTGLAAAGMGVCGYFFSNSAVFYVSAGLALPALIALARIRGRDIQPLPHASGGAAITRAKTAFDARHLARNRPLLIFCACFVLFQLANAAMLPLVASMLTLRARGPAAVPIAIALIVPQFIVMLLSPWIGRLARRWGRRPLLLIGFAALPIRGALFALITDPSLVVAVQLLDGISAAVLGVLVPLVIADATRDSGHFNLAQGLVGCASGIGASVSTTFIGYITDRFGSHASFITMTYIAMIGLWTVFLLMPETRPDEAQALTSPGS